MENAENEVPVPTRLSRLESMLESILGALNTAAPIASLIPGAAPVIAGVEAVGTVAVELMRDVDGSGTVDAAALAAGNISKSTGDASLDARLAEIESLVHAALPILKTIAKHFGVDLSALEIEAKPMSVA